MAQRRLQRFFLYLGSKRGVSRYYPKPKHDTIIEPFAGAAGYSTEYYDRQVILVELNPTVYAVWKYLISADANEIAGLPDVQRGQDLRELGLTYAQTMLIGFWVVWGKGEVSLKVPDAGIYVRSSQGWGKEIREKIASQVEEIRHWKVIYGQYFFAPDIKATWFIDPPYDCHAGDGYEKGRGEIDYRMLAKWCRSRKGQVIVCEAEGANWLPFRPLFVSGNSTRKKFTEVAWIRN